VLISVTRKFYWLSWLSPLWMKSVPLFSPWKFSCFLSVISTVHCPLNHCSYWQYCSPDGKSAPIRFISPLGGSAAVSWKWLEKRSHGRCVLWKNLKPGWTISLYHGRNGSHYSGLLQVPSVTAGVVRMRLISFFEGVALSSLIKWFYVIFLGFSARFLLPRMDTQPKTYLGVSFCALIAFVWIILFLCTAINPWNVRNKKNGYLNIILLTVNNRDVLPLFLFQTAKSHNKCALHDIFSWQVSNNVVIRSIKGRTDRTWEKSVWIQPAKIFCNFIHGFIDERGYAPTVRDILKGAPSVLPPSSSITWMSSRKKAVSTATPKYSAASVSLKREALSWFPYSAPLLPARPFLFQQR